MVRPERWVTAERVDWLVKVYPLHCVAETCRLFNDQFGTNILLSQMLAANRHHRFGYAKRTGEHNKYTKEMIEWTRDIYLKQPLNKTAKEFEQRFNMSITEAALSNLATTHQFDKRTPHTANSGSFKKGHKNGKQWEKGECGDGCEKGWFKKGSTPANRVPMFTERWRGRKRPELYIKIPQPCPYTSKPFRWYSKARHVWEQENGDIPTGHVIVHLDGNQANCEIENIECVPRKTLAFLNSKYAQKTEHKELKPTLLRIAQLKVAIHERVNL